MEQQLKNNIAAGLFAMDFGRKQFLDFFSDTQRGGQEDELQAIATKLDVSLNILRVFVGASKREQKEARHIRSEEIRKANAKYTVLVTDDCNVLEELGHKTGQMEMGGANQNLLELILGTGKQRVLLIRNQAIKRILMDQYQDFCNGATWIENTPALKREDEVCQIGSHNGQIRILIGLLPAVPFQG